MRETQNPLFVVLTLLFFTLGSCAEGDLPVQLGDQNRANPTEPNQEPPQDETITEDTKESDEGGVKVEQDPSGPGDNNTDNNTSEGGEAAGRDEPTITAEETGDHDTEAGIFDPNQVPEACRLTLTTDAKGNFESTQESSTRNLVVKNEDGSESLQSLTVGIKGGFIQQVGEEACIYGPDALGGAGPKKTCPFTIHCGGNQVEYFRAINPSPPHWFLKIAISSPDPDPLTMLDPYAPAFWRLGEKVEGPINNPSQTSCPFVMQEEDYDGENIWNKINELNEVIQQILQQYLEIENNRMAYGVLISGEMSEAESSHHYSGKSIITLDLDGDNKNDLVDTDLVADLMDLGETPSKTALPVDRWVSYDPQVPHDGDGILLLDRNPDGVISQQDLFGGKAIVGRNVSNGFEDLALHDTNGDGVINQNDSSFLYPGYRVWKDFNGDGERDPGELFTLGEAGIASLNVSYFEVYEGNTVHQGTFKSVKAVDLEKTLENCLALLDDLQSSIIRD